MSLTEIELQAVYVQDTPQCIRPLGYVAMGYQANDALNATTPPACNQATQ